MNFISREAVLAVIDRHLRGSGYSGHITIVPIREAICALPNFPAPNPAEAGGRNVMGQTEEEFWSAADRQEQT